MAESPAAGRAAVEVDRLSKTYRPAGRRPPVQALRELSFSVRSGSVFGMLGPNGAGKSTTTKILTTLTRPSSGSASVAGIDVAAGPSLVRRRIGYVSQGASTDPLLTGAENLTLAGRLRGMNKQDARGRARELLADFGLAEAADRPVGTFSGGMRRRLDVANALVHAPEILFLDEPTTGLDPEARAAMWTEVRRLSAERAVTVILTTHYMEEADRLADDLMIIDRGVRVAGGSPDELKSALNGDTLRVALIEPDQAAVRAAAGTVRGLREVVVEVQGTGGQLVARTENASAAVGPTIAALESAGIAFGAVAASRPTLDDVYLHYTGRSFDESGLTLPDEKISDGAAA